ncbi:uncharacterized protein CEXT_182631 [Caerostris extrusa]|uniref:Uncharacterized protein n=1 Tax=Caerostris extrusa TaxID=172846 RepID=A0AAV4SIL9_CAEEX|nr:uncharacterized protein CEXT_182631 [Caerostris extrusa]
MSGWMEIFLESVQELKSSKEVCKISEHINVIPSFMVHDLKQCIVHNEEMKMKMRNADIVFLVKVLSHIPHEYKLTVLKNIIWSMSQGSILIYIDNPAPSTVFQQLNDNLDLKYEIENKRYRFNLNTLPSRFNWKTCNCKACVKIFSIK